MGVLVPNYGFRGAILIFGACIFLSKCLELYNYINNILYAL